MPQPQAENILNGYSFKPGDTFTATFVLNRPIERSFTAFAVIILPNGTMRDAITLSPVLTPVAVNLPGLGAPLRYRLLSTIVPRGAPSGKCEIVVAFFDPGQSITDRSDAFLEASTPFVLM